MKKLAVLLPVLLLVLLAACGKAPSADTPMPSDAAQELTPSQEQMPSQEFAQADAPRIDSDSLYQYIPGIYSDYSWDVGEPVVSEGTATYSISASSEERFANMTGTYELVLGWDASAAMWVPDSDLSGWVETDFSLNPDEFFSPEYYWAAYPLSPTKSDPVYLWVTDITDSECTLSWWTEEEENSCVEGSYDGNVTAPLRMEYESDINYPRWVVEDVTLTSVINSRNPISFSFVITPKNFSIVPDNDSAKYVGIQSIPLSRIQNTEYYDTLIVAYVSSGLHQDLVDLGMEMLEEQPELLCDAAGSEPGDIWIENLGYAGSIYMTGNGRYRNQLYILYGAEMGIQLEGSYAPKYRVTYYAIAFQNLDVDGSGLTYEYIDESPHNDAVLMPIYKVGGRKDVLVYGSESVEEAREHCESVLGKVYSLTYIWPDEEGEEFLDYLSYLADGKLGLSWDGDLKITKVAEGGAAEAAGMQVGDVMVAIYGNSIEGKSSSIVAEILQGTVGSTVELTVRRNGTEHTFTLVRQMAT